MAVRKRLDWTNVLAGLVIAVGAAVFSRLMAQGDSVGALTAKAQMYPDRRDRELDQVIARLSALESRRCAP